MKRQSIAMNDIYRVLKSLKRGRSRLSDAYGKRILYTVQLNRSKDDNRCAKFSDLIDLEDKHIHDIKEYISDLINDLKYQVDQYDTEIDIEVRECRQTLDQL